ncbi:MAG: hypothetical protein KatS3mg051_1030 [Anaerolineae bacterium]|nr:MAG: hypothetical protein KatS3mg051_1030 [Anaerolineae bacterium]
MKKMKRHLKTVVQALEHESLEYNDLITILQEDGVSEDEAKAVIAEAEACDLIVGEYLDVPGGEWAGTYYVWGESEELAEFLDRFPCFPVRDAVGDGGEQALDGREADTPS